MTLHSRKFRALSFVLLLGVAASIHAQGSAPTSTISFVVGNTTLGTGDQAVLDALEVHGHTVIVHDDGGISAAATAGSDAVIISSTIGSNQVLTTFRNDPRPVFVWEAGLLGDLGMTGAQENVDWGFELGLTQISLVAANSPIGDGLAPATVTITTGAEDTAWGAPGSAAFVVATVLGNPDRAVLFTYDQGAELADGSPAPGKRLGFFGDNDSASAWTADGQLLFEQAIEWVLVPTPAAPVIAVPPYAENVADGGTAVFSIVAGGYPEPTYQWQKDGDDLSGETNSTLSIIVGADDPGSYSVVVTNSEGTVASDPVLLTLVDSWTFSFVVSNPATPIASDQSVVDKLTRHGHTVLLHDDNGITLGATAGSDAVILSSSGTAANVGGTFAADPRPVLTWDVAIYGDMGMTAGDVVGVDLDITGLQTRIALADVSTRTGAGFAVGPIIVAASPVVFGWGVPGGDAQVIATLADDPTKATIFMYEQDDLLADGGTAAGVRIGFHQWTNGAAAWSAAGEQLFEQAVVALFDNAIPAAPTITTQPQDETVVNGDTATFTVVADGVPAPNYQWRFNGADIPGETDSTLSLTATVDDGGDYDVVVTNSSGSVTSDIATLAVNSAVNQAPTFTSAPVTDVDEGSLYSYAITTDDPDAGDTLTISAPTLPVWLVLNDNGNGTATLRGTPAQAHVGSHPVELEVSDADGATDTQSFTITVADVEFSPTFTSRPVTAVTEGQAYVYTIVAADADGDPVNLVAGTIPIWLTLTNNGDGTGELLGFPGGAQIGTHAVELFAEDGSGTTAASQSFNIVVNAAADGPVITLIGNQQMTLRQGQTFTDPGATATDPQDGNLTSAIVVNNPVNTQVVGTYTVIYSVTDTAGNLSQAQRTVVIQRQPDGGGGALGFGEMLAFLILAGGAVWRSAGRVVPDGPLARERRRRRKMLL